MWNEILDAEIAEPLIQIVRGLVEACINNPQTFYDFGVRASELDKTSGKDSDRLDFMLQNVPANDKPI